MTSLRPTARSRGFRRPSREDRHVLRTWLRGALLGLVAAGSGLAVSELASGYLHQRVSPVAALAEEIIRLTPGRVIEFVISLVGHNDKPLLIAMTLLGVAVVSAAIGVLAMRSTLIAQLVFVGLGFVLAWAVDDRLTSSQSTYIPTILGVVTTLVVLAVLAPKAAKADQADRDARAARAAVPGEEPASPAATSRSRREFLQWSGVVAAGAVVVGVVGLGLERGRAAVEEARRRLRLKATDPPPPGGTSVGVDGIAPWKTSQDRFYRIDTALVVPQILPKDWSIRIHGMVDRELTLTYDELVARGLTEAWLTLCCVSNVVGGDLISNAWFSGVKVSTLLADVGVHPDADAVRSTSDDGWTAGTPIGALTDDRNAMLAVAMNGEPLTPEHGFPVRMVVPGLYGYVSGTKWIRDIEVTRFADFSAFWTDRGWSPQGPVKTESRIDVPNGGAHVDAGSVAVGGVAWAQHTGISRVEVRVDDGDWAEATLGSDPTTDSWRQWAYAWDATPGQHQLQVRATDNTGYTQTGQRVDVVPNGATGWHTIDVSVG
jgi:DMSO/TMAO reductase YedYZ molybdopterin-dependent catalytic subunit